MDKNEVSKDKNIKLISIHDEISSSYLSYAMSVIVSRALPDVRDGLKPVPVSYTHLTLPTTPYV